MDGETLVPLNWVFYLIGMCVAGLFWWLLDFRKRNDQQHVEARSDIKEIHRRIDHMIVNLLPQKPYKPPPGEEN